MEGLEEAPVAKNNKSKIVITLIIVSLILAAIVIYSNYSKGQSNYRKHIQNAEDLFSSGDYDSAYEQIKDDNLKNNDLKLLEKIKLLKSSKMYLANDDQLDPANGEADYKSILINLLSGISFFKENSISADELGVSEELEEIYNQYLEQLSQYYGLKEEKIEEIQAMSGEEKELNINRIVPRAKQRIHSAKMEEANKELREQEILLNPIQITEKSAQRDGDYMYATGSVKNVSSNSYSFIKLKITYSDDSGNVIDTDWTYAVGAENLLPNEQHSFDFMTKYRNGMSKYRIEVVEFN
ncbi:hypothetical protein JI735_34730 (plasmid) [Paenibacillus sonchi]|uniref:Uncharacterized protein n=1 Tax=Paenibacillus sonchi TaxID=373687 RepID=A0A974SHE6_9BACL|nr:FxLYD domain-containing protein [Paenibacillus sonchi]QQZ64585.1 hypothetical protein JI735_34730 [Paenibacillus sonchi]